MVFVAVALIESVWRGMTSQAPAPATKKPHGGGFGRGLVCQPGGCMNGISAFAAFTRTLKGAAVWLTSAKSHFAGQSVVGRPCTSTGRLRAPAGLPAPFLRPPQPVELDCFSIPDFFCEWEAMGLLALASCRL